MGIDMGINFQGVPIEAIAIALELFIPVLLLLSGALGNF